MITRVDVTTERRAGMVVVPKSEDHVRICMDLNKLNESVCCERHLLPVVEQILPQICGAKYFSKLDANSRFWQILLSPESSLLTTFITPFGRFCFCRLSFCFTLAPDHFKKTDVINPRWDRGLSVPNR